MPISRGDILEKYGEEVQFLFKGAEPFTPNEKNIPMGVVLADTNGDLICWNCDQSFSELGKHVRKHGYSASEYKREYGINQNVPLCNKANSARYSMNAVKNNLSNKGRAFPKGTRVAVGRRRVPTMQEHNSDNSCPEQLVARLRLVASLTADGNPTARDCVKHDTSLVTILERRFGTFNEAKKALGYTPLPTGVTKSLKEDATMIYDLRNFIKEHGRMPWDRNSRPLMGFPHGRYSYKNHFGSFDRAYAVCGIEKVGFNTYVCKD